jgi:MSHA biogenesis protein MshJ
VRARWLKLAARIDALTTRERALVFVAGLVVIAFLAWIAVLQPLAARNRALAARLVAQADTLAALAAQKRELEDRLRAGPDEALRSRIAELDARLQTVDAALADVQSGLIEPAQMSGVIKEMLARNPALRLLGLRTLPATPFGDREPSSASAASADEMHAGIYKHGLEITVEGSYPDLLAYAAHLENLPARVLWNRTRVDASGYPRVTMTLTLYTLSLERTWLTI